jgi:hypothetical protein
MVADQPRQPRGSASPRARLRWLAIVVGVMALLTAGWPLLNASVADKQQLAPRASLRVGPSGRDSASVRVGQGWFVRPAQTDPSQEYMLRRGAVAISIGYVSLLGRYQAAGLWDGLRRVLRVSNPGVSLGQPAAVTTGQGREGLVATAASARSAGVVSVFVGPSGTYAIQIVVLAPRSARLAAGADSSQLIRSLRFPTVRYARPARTARSGRPARAALAAAQSPAVQW